MPRVRFHKPGQYAHSNPKNRHQQVPAAQLEQDVNDDMLAQCIKFDWAEVIFDDRVEKPAAGDGAQYDGELPNKPEPLLTSGAEAKAEEKKTAPKPPSKKKAASRKKAAAKKAAAKPSALE